MRIVVLGATGYVGSRLVPALLSGGHEVVAASSSPSDPNRFAWGHQVTWRQCDVTDDEAVERTLRDADDICYLVHSLSRRGFADLDRVGAAHVRDAASAAGVRRIVYLSGLVPGLDRGQALSAHLASRLEVENILAASSCSTLSVRAGVVIGAGSTSYEVVRQLASLLLVQPVPSWMRTLVQPDRGHRRGPLPRDGLRAGSAGGQRRPGRSRRHPLPRPACCLRSRCSSLPRARAGIRRAGRRGRAVDGAAGRGAVPDRHGARREPAARHGVPSRPHSGSRAGSR